VRRGWQYMSVLLCLGCAGKLRDPDRFDFLIPDASEDSDADTADSSTPASTAAPACLVTIFQNSCGTTTCHAAGALQIDLLSPNVAQRLIGKPSAATGVCANRVLVATDGGASLLVDKVSASPPCGSPMPLGGTALSTDQRSCLTSWVQSVAGSKGGGN
jgi:hypothetical protein